MRTFFISLLLLVLTICFCLWNFAAVGAETQALLSLAISIPTPDKEESLSTPAVTEVLEATQSHWQAKRTLLAIGVSEHTLDSIERALVDLEAYAQGKDLASFLSARAELVLSITRLRALERTVL